MHPQTAAQIENMFRTLLSRNAYALGRADYYGIEVQITAARPDILSFALTFRFRRGERYCCMEPQCHFGRWNEAHWKQIRQTMAQLGLDGLPAILIEKLRVIVEEGAQFGLRFPGDGRPLQIAESSICELGPFYELVPNAP